MPKSEVLKPQDVLVVCKIYSLGNREWSYAGLGAEIGLSAGETHNSVERCKKAQLLTVGGTVSKKNLRDLLVVVVPQVYYAVRGNIVEGMPAATHAAPLRAEFKTNGSRVADSRVADSRVADSRVADSRVADSRVADSRVADPMGSVWPRRGSATRGSVTRGSATRAEGSRGSATRAAGSQAAGSRGSATQAAGSQAAGSLACDSVNHESCNSFADSSGVVGSLRLADVRGESLAPIYPTVPEACERDPVLHELLALCDVIRIGSHAERERAITFLDKRLGRSS